MQDFFDTTCPVDVRPADQNHPIAGTKHGQEPAGLQPQDIETGLTYVAVAAGNVTRAAEQLKAEGNKPIPEATLRDRKNRRHVIRYTEIVAEREHIRREATAERLNDLVQQEIGAVQATLDSYREKLEKTT